MAKKKESITPFTGELNVAIRAATIRAAVNVIQNNPDMTMEDFYTMLWPHGVTQTMTLGDIASALAPRGDMAIRSGSMSTAPITAKPLASWEVPQITVKPLASWGVQRVHKKKAFVKKSGEINCRSKADQEAYHRSIIEYLAAADAWVRGPDIAENCGGKLAQVGTAMRKHLIPSGLAKNKGISYGVRFSITSKGKRKAASGSAITSDRSSSKALKKSKLSANILRYLHGNKWRSGPEISEACGCTPDHRKMLIKTMIRDGVIEHNGKKTGAARWRLLHS